MLYFYILDHAEFVDSIHPALARSWQRRSFEPCRELCRRLVPRARSFFPGSEQSPHTLLLEQVAAGLVFDRRFWRHLAGEMLMYAALESPRLETAADTLCCLLSPATWSADTAVVRSLLAPIQQAHQGSRDLVFGSAPYRPESAGWNNSDDIDRLTRYLTEQCPARWTVADLQRLDLTDEERAAELEYAQHWFEPLRDMYQAARATGKIIVCEDIA